jgi:hypothetical protein
MGLKCLIFWRFLTFIFLKAGAKKATFGWIVKFIKHGIKKSFLWQKYSVFRPEIWQILCQICVLNLFMSAISI